MVMVAIGAAKLRHWWDTPRFVTVAILSLRHAKRSAGNLHAEVFPMRAISFHSPSGSVRKTSKALPPPGHIGWR